MAQETPPVWGTTITARHLRNFQVQVIIEPGDRSRGPWSFIIDEGPQAGGDGIGPPPVPVAMAALGA